MEAQTNPRKVLVITTLTSFLTPFISSSVNIALPPIGRELGLSAVTQGWIASSFLLTTAVLLLPAGRLTDIYGRVKLFKIGIIIFSAGSLLCALATGGLMLILFRVIQGTGAAFIFSTSTAILVSSYPPESRGKALGINVAAVYTGLCSGPILGGIIVEHLNWRHLFSINSLFGLLIIILAQRILRMEWAEAKGEKFDLTGSLIYGLVLTALMYGLSILPSLTGFTLIAAGFTGLIFFIHYEKRIESPLLNIRLFIDNKRFTFSYLAALINYSATFATGFLLSFYLQYIRGFSPKEAGMVLISQPVIMALFSPLTGRLSDRIDAGKVASAGMAVTMAGLLILSFLTPPSLITLIIISLVMLGFGFALLSSPNTNAIMSSVEKKISGPGIRINVNNAYVRTDVKYGDNDDDLFIIGTGKLTPNLHPALMSAIKLIFLLFTVFFLGIFASLARGKVK